MIFLRYESFRSYLRSYPVTAAIIVINILVYALDHLVFDGSLLEHGYFYSGGAYNYFSLDEPWRYVTAEFLHADLSHIFFNMFSILVFAPPLERMLGHVRYAIFYLLCGVVGHLFVAIADGQPTIGASGCIYGVFGTYLYLALFKRSLDPESRKTVYMILIFGVIFSLIGTNVSIWGHIGGLFAGVVLAYAYDWYVTLKQNRR
ncbi:rhomboid family intramembrane serine protease [Paenibacillus albus]|uniref:Rhomboid family intramembrane serine protease n=1 Tax=Paenibacillus albus TaxID=2495582 RepID=A0A3Q8X542_9BACL|nr:rhomboid family intramembrane serine protease [Paenibacillus albus]AZN40270.1 rhomboid family intramembrane serine protease [Paenibacillus albus]